MNLPTSYPTVPSPTLYDVPFSHNTKRYRQTDRRQTDRTSYHKRDRTTQYGRLTRSDQRSQTRSPRIVLPPGQYKVSILVSKCPKRRSVTARPLRKLRSGARDAEKMGLRDLVFPDGKECWIIIHNRQKKSGSPLKSTVTFCLGHMPNSSKKSPRSVRNL